MKMGYFISMALIIGFVATVAPTTNDSLQLSQPTLTSVEAVNSDSENQNNSENDFNDSKSRSYDTSSSSGSTTIREVSQETNDVAKTTTVTENTQETNPTTVEKSQISTITTKFTGSTTIKEVSQETNDVPNEDSQFSNNFASFSDNETQLVSITQTYSTTPEDFRHSISGSTIIKYTTEVSTEETTEASTNASTNASAEASTNGSTQVTTKAMTQVSNLKNNVKKVADYIIFTLLGFTVAMFLFGCAYIFYVDKGIDLAISRKPTKFKHRSSSALASVAAEAKLTKIPMVRFHEYYIDLNRDSGWKFSLQYEALRCFSFVYPCIEAKKSENMSKNRWIDIVPFDHSIVKLFESSLEDAIPNYINASYIPGHNSIRQYIATQGPLPCTLNDFWKMVWLENSPVIVMLAQCEEKSRIKCAQYWPTDDKPHSYGNLSVTLLTETENLDYVMRIIKLEPAALDMDEPNFKIECETDETADEDVEAYPLMPLDNKTMEIKQFHFTSWPDKGCPQSATSLLKFIQEIHDNLPVPSQGPIIVHCSAGVGRTGTFIAIHHLMEMINDSGEVNVYEIVESMRKHRMNMVQTEDQYIFIHDCLLELVKSNST